MAKKKKNLGEYRRKRDFAQTPEPASSARARAESQAATRRRFVVHRHEASRLHYDLRLEMDGVLRSFAVPRVFSYDTSVKRLAVRTEDHPIEYLEFEGVIPPGQYGAGTMTIWDRGEYVNLLSDDPSQSVTDGKLELTMHGMKLRGEWHLFLTNPDKDEWLLIKTSDRFATATDDPALTLDLRKAKPATRRAPGRMQPKLERPPFDDSDWLFEMEFDGQRVQASCDGEKVAVHGFRGGRKQALRIPKVEAALQELRADRAVIDGVLVAPDEQERPSAAALEARLAGEDQGPIYLYAFDLLTLEGWDLRPLRLVDRKSALASVLPEGTSLLFVDHVLERGVDLARAATATGIPGLIAKRCDSPYASGASASWRRIPLEEEDEDAQDLSFREALERSAGQSKSTRRKLRITNRDKIFWPEDDFTKGHLIDYYEAIGPVILPYLRDRPMHLNRFPDGIYGESFYQKNTPASAPDWIRTEVIPSNEHHKPIRYVICNEISTLLYLANWGSVDLHPWSSRLGTLDSPDWAILDLDPKSAPWTHVVKIAREAGKVLRGVGLRPLVKTSGKTGIHVYVPVKQGYTYEHVRMFCEGIARFLVRAHPDICTVERNVNQRGGKVYVDYLQNRKSQTVVPPYVVRPCQGATVSTPLNWDELDHNLERSTHSILNVPQRVERMGDLFEAALTDRQDLMPAIEALQGLL